MAQHSDRSHAQTAPLIVLGFVILAAGHLLLYVLLTADARAGVAAARGGRTLEALEAARDPGAAPQPGSATYVAWLRDYEAWWASKDLALHARHERMMKGGMGLSFLVGLVLLLQATVRPAGAREKRRAPRQSLALRPRSERTPHATARRLQRPPVVRQPARARRPRAGMRRSA